jgi:hypothetical protein
MTDENRLSDIQELSHELEALLKRCDLYSYDIAAALVSAAVVLTARDGCDPYEQEQSIARFANNAIVRLIRLSELEATRH